MIKKLIATKKSKAQALVEFALVLTLLLTLLYGILEAGRLLFVYASTVTAARQASRYGSATGNSPAGMPYYKDCAGIRAAAQKVGFLSPFTPANILITYDNGPGTANLAWTCLPGAAFSGGTVATGNRVKVCVSTTWRPIIVALVPLSWSGTTNCSGTVTPNAITKQSERTLLSSISIGVTAIPGAWSGSGNLSLAVSASPATYSATGQLITYTYTMRNTGSIDLVGPFSLTANNTSTTCGAGTTLYPGQTLVCTGTYYIVQQDLDDGVVVSLTTATTSGASSAQISTTVTAVQNKQLTLAKSASPTSASVAGRIITYTYTLRNSGNVTLSPPYTVTDNKTSVTCSSIDAIAPGGTTTCTVNYPLKQSPDIDDGILINTATATAKFGSTTITSNTASATVYTSKLVLTIVTSSTTAINTGQVITYSYIVYNNSGAVAASPTITDSKFTVSCPAASIPDQTSITCAPVATTPATYTVTLADMNAGTALTNTATARANGGAIASRAVNVSIPVVQSPALSLAISNITTNPVSAGTPTVTAVGTNNVTFTYTLTNSGNVTLSPPYDVSSLVRHDTFTNPAATCTLPTVPATVPVNGLVPGASTTCTGSMSIIAADLNGTYGAYVINHASATAKFGIAIILSAQQTGIVATYNGARLALGITADPTNAPSTGTPITFTYTLTSTGNAPVILPSPYSIAWTITLGAGAAVAQPSFVCASPITTIPVNSSTTCTGTSSYTTTAAAGNVTNNATAPATNAPPATAQVIVTRNFLCDITHSGPVPDTDTSGPGKDKTTWSIYNKTGGAVHIDSITLIWATLNKSIKNVNLSGTSVWSGSTSASGFPITSSTPSFPGSSLTWPLTVNTGSQPMVLTFSGSTTGIQVILAFSEPSCSAGLDSANPAQQGTWP